MGRLRWVDVYGLGWLPRVCLGGSPVYATSGYETTYLYRPHVVAWECVHMHGSIFELVYSEYSVTPTFNVNVAFFF